MLLASIAWTWIQVSECTDHYTWAWKNGTQTTNQEWERRKPQLVEEVERHEKYVPRTVHIVVIQILQQEELSLNK